MQSMHGQLYYMCERDWLCSKFGRWNNSLYAQSTDPSFLLIERCGTKNCLTATGQLWALNNIESTFIACMQQCTKGQIVGSLVTELLSKSVKSIFKLI